MRNHVNEIAAGQELLLDTYTHKRIVAGMPLKMNSYQGYIRTKKAAEDLGISQRAVQSLIQRGLLAAINIGDDAPGRALWLVDESEIKRRKRSQAKRRKELL